MLLKSKAWEFFIAAAIQPNSKLIQHINQIQHVNFQSSSNFSIVLLEGKHKNLNKRSLKVKKIESNYIGIYLGGKNSIYTSAVSLIFWYFFFYNNINKIL